MKQDLEPDWPLLEDDVMSNFDHVIDRKVEQALRDGEVKAQYSGWNFCGYCWFADGQFHCAVYRYHAQVAIMSAETLEELMQLVSNDFGWK